MVVNGVHSVDMEAMGHSYENNYFSFDLHNATEVQNGDIISLDVVTAN